MSYNFEKSSPYGPVADSRHVISLGELCVPIGGIQTGPFGSQLHSSDYVAEGTPIITVEHLNDNYITGDEMPLVSHEDVMRLAKYSLKTGDIVFSRVGSVDRRALVTETEDGWLFSGRLLRIRTNPELIDPTYLSYFFGLASFKNYIRQIAVGATMPSLNTEIMASLPIVVPAIEEQKSIGSFLRKLDEKIRVNQQIASTLEQIAQTIFKSWFVDFDPVYAKARGEQPVGMDAETAALFPDSFEESELGSIPSGWQVSRIDAIANVMLGGTPSKSKPEYWDGDIPWINSGAVNDFRIIRPSAFITKLGYEKSSTKLLRPGATVLAITGATLGQYSRVEISTTANQSVIGLETMNVNADEYVYLWISNYVSELVAKATGGAQQHINRNDVCEQILLVPSEPILFKFSSFIRPLFHQISSLLFQSTTLSELRDSLLPRLISGELEIPTELLEA